MSTTHTSITEARIDRSRASAPRLSLVVPLLVWLIGIYQRYVSPYKGFRCAHRVRHGGLSCSEAVRAILLEDGIWLGWSRVREQFRSCHSAAQALRRERSRAEMAFVEPTATEAQPPASEDGEKSEESRANEKRQQALRKNECPAACVHGCGNCIPDCGGLPVAADCAGGADFCSCTPW